MPRIGGRGDRTVASLAPCRRQKNHIMKIEGGNRRRRSGMWNPATRIRFRKSWWKYVFCGEGVRIKFAREEEEETVGSFMYCFSEGSKPILELLLWGRSELIESQVYSARMK